MEEYFKAKDKFKKKQSIDDMIREFIDIEARKLKEGSWTLEEMKWI